MKKFIQKNTHSNWQHLSAPLLLCCLVSAPLPALASWPDETPAQAQAQTPALAQTKPQTQAKIHIQNGGEAALNFVGADIESVVKAVGHYINVTFVIDPRVKGTINLVSEKTLSKAQAFDLLTTTLRLQGFAVVMGDGFAKVVPESDAKLQAGPTKIGSAANVAKGDQIVTQVFRINYESATNLVTVLRPLIAANNTINANPGNNTLVITDYADNLKRLGKIIAALDAPAMVDIDVITIRHALASDIAVMVNRLLESNGSTATGTTGAGAAAGTGGEGRISVLADPRTNTVILRAPSVARANLAKSLIEKLDQPTANPGNVHVVYLKNADAVKLAATLRAVVSADTSAISTSNTASPSNSASSTAFGSSSSSSSSSASIANISTGSSTVSGALSTSSNNAGTSLATGSTAGFIQADPTTNTLIITANEAVYRNLRSVIDQLDVRRAQVYIESLIVEVSADKAAEFGIQWLGLSGNSESSYRIGGISASSIAGNNNIVSLATAQSAANPGAGLTLGIFRQINGQLGLGALAHALESDSNANILSVPNLITLDNEEAKIIVGQNVPFITGQYTTQASGSSTGVNPFQTIERKDVGLALRVRPQVSEGGTVKLAIYQETSSVQNSSNAAGIITSKRAIETNVLADDGQIIVLGGLIEDNVQDDAEKVRGLGDIPVLGNLFKYQKRERKKTNLMVFLRPTVIRNNAQSANVVADRYDYIRGAQVNAKPASTILLPDTGSPVLPQLSNGRPVGGALLQNGVEATKATGLPPKAAGATVELSK